MDGQIFPVPVPGSGGGGGGYPSPVIVDAVSAASAIFASVIVPAYRDYEIRLSDITFSVNSASLQLVFSTDNGVTWDTASSYRRNGGFVNVDGTNVISDLGTSLAAFWPIIVLGQRNTGTGDAGSAKYTLFNPLSSTTYKRMVGLVEQIQQVDATEYVMFMGMKYLNVNAVNAIKFTPSSGTFSGRITVQPLP